MEKMDRGEVRKLLAEGKTPQEVAAIFEARQAAAASAPTGPVEPNSPTALYGTAPSVEPTPDVTPAIVAAPDKEKHELNKDSLLTYIREFSTGAEGVILDQGVFASQFNIPIAAAQRLVNTLVEKGIIDTEHKVIISGLVAGNISEAEIAEAIKEPVAAVVTPDVAPKAPEKKYGFTNRELLEFLKTKAGTNFSDSTLLENFNLSKEHAAEVIRDLKQARIIGDDDKVMDGATLERAEKDFEGHPTETLDDEYTFVSTAKDGPASVAAAPVIPTLTVTTPDTSVVPPVVVAPAAVDPAPDVTATPEQPKTLEDFLKIPDWEDKLENYLGFSGLKDDDLESTINEQIEHQAVYYKEDTKIRSQVLMAIHETWRNYYNNWENAGVYKKILEASNFLTDTRISKDQQNTIEDFLNEYEDIVEGLKHELKALEEAEKKVRLMTDDELRKIAEVSPAASPAVTAVLDPVLGAAPGAPDSEPADPEERNTFLSGLGDKAKAIISWRTAAIACVVAFGVGLAVNNYQTKPEQAKPAAEKTEPKPDASKPAQKSPDANKDAKALEVAPNPNYAQSDWWKMLDSEVQEAAKGIIEAKSAEEYALNFFKEDDGKFYANDIQNRPIELSESGVREIFKKVNGNGKLLNDVYFGVKDETLDKPFKAFIPNCAVQVKAEKDEPSGPESTCYVQVPFAKMAKSFHTVGVREMIWTMGEKLDEGKTVEETFAINRKKIIEMVNEHTK